MLSEYGARGAAAFGSNEINPVTIILAYYSGNSVCILFVPFAVLVVSIFVSLYSVGLCMNLDVLY